MAISINPMATQNALGSFNVQSGGYVQGLMSDDAVNIYKVAGGVVKSNQIGNLWAGMAITEFIPSSDDPLGSQIALASDTSVNNISGFLVGNLNHSAIITQTSNVPLISAQMGAQFVRLGSGVRIALAIDPSLASLDGGMTNQAVSWDFTNQQIVPYNTQTSQLTISAMTWSAGVVSATTSATNTLATGNWITISGDTAVGYNIDTPITVTDTTHFTFPLAVNPGASGGSPVVLAGGGALPVKILKMQIGNSRVAVQDLLGNVNYNNSGSCALVLL
jgi:hypothetical protein